MGMRLWLFTEEKHNQLAGEKKEGKESCDW
jgi:hypothetical protein